MALVHAKSSEIWIRSRLTAQNLVIKADLQLSKFMDTIGDRLEDARKRQGISIREAAEATKIRSDFLVYLENNQFEFDMPEVYRRGFLKLYAKFLKLDVEKILTDYQALVLGNSQHAKQDGKALLGRIDLPEDNPFEGPSPAARMNRFPDASRQSEAEDAEPGADFQNGAFDPSGIYLKVGMVVGGTALLAFLAVLIGTWLTSGGEQNRLDASNPVASDSVANNFGSGLDDVPAINDNNVNIGSVIISSRGDTRLWVRQINDERILYDARIGAGETITLERSGPVRVASSNFDYLTIDIDGQVYRAEAEGVGQNIFY